MDYKKLGIGEREIKFRFWVKEELRMENDAVGYFAGETCRMFAQKQLVFMEYTGLKDKNRKEIFEGDIIGIDEKKFRGVIINEKRPPFIVTIPEFYEINLFFGRQKESVFEIIGNIFENINLIENDRK